jgi:hypothetical protein
MKFLGALNLFAYLYYFVLDSYVVLDKKAR